MIKTKSEKGSMTLFVIIGFIFCMTILVSLVWSSSNYQVTVLQAQQRIKETYEADVKNMDKIHQELTAS